MSVKQRQLEALRRTNLNRVALIDAVNAVMRMIGQRQQISDTLSYLVANPPIMDQLLPQRLVDWEL